MFLDVVSTHTKCIMNDFALAPRTDLLNFKCHTVTNGTDLRKSPPSKPKSSILSHLNVESPLRRRWTECD